MNDDSVDGQQVARLITLEEDDLYGMLVPDGAAFNQAGRIAAGKEALQRLVNAGRAQVCAAYRANRESVKDAGDLVKVVTESLQVVIAIAGLKVPVIPAAVLLVKLGLDKLCPAPAS